MTYNNESLVLQPNSPWFDRPHLQKALRHQPADLFNWINQSSQLFGAATTEWLATFVATSATVITGFASEWLMTRLASKGLTIFLMPIWTSRLAPA